MMSPLTGVVSKQKGSNMIRISIASTAVRSMRGNSKVSGKPYDLAFQDAWFHTIGKDGVAAPYPQKVEIILPRADDGAALFYAVGEYQLAPSSVYVDRNGKLSIEPHLVALKPAAVARPAQA